MQIHDLEDLEAFLAVYRLRSFTKAAQSMRTSSSAISKRISRLESTFKVKLFIRSTRVVQPSEAAEKIQAIAERVLKDMQEIGGTFQKHNRIEGNIRITAAAPIARRLLPKALAAFTTTYPKVTFEIILTDSFLNMAEHNLDLALRIGSHGEQSLISKKLIDNHLVACAAPIYLKRHGEPKAVKDLHRHPFIFHDAHRNACFSGTDIALNEFAKARAFKSNDGAMLTDLILAGAAVGVRSWWDVRDDLATGRLKAILDKFPFDTHSDVQLVFPANKYLPARVRAFIDFLGGHIH